MLRRVVADDLGAELAEDPFDAGIADVDVHEPGALGNVLASSAAVRPKAVDDDDLVTGSKVRIGHM